jgi:hypothetical protein
MRTRNEEILETTTIIMMEKTRIESMETKTTMIVGTTFFLLKIYPGQ